MKTFKLLSLLFVFLSFTLVGVAQNEEEESQMFGTRSLKPPVKAIDFGKTSSEVITKTFELVNNDNTPVEVVGFDIPDGVGVKVTKKVIEPKGKSVFTVMLYPEAVTEAGDYSKNLKVTTVQISATGEKVTKEVIYILKAKK